MLKIVLLLLVVVAVAVFFTRMQGDQYAKFKANSREVMGRIEKKQTRIDNPKTLHTEQVLIYSYEIDGKRYTGEERVEYDDLWQEAREGAELRVYVSKKNANQSHPAALIDRRIGIADQLK